MLRLALLLLLLPLLALTLPACTSGNPDSPLTVTMRVGHSAPVAGDRAILHILEADADEQSARIGVACGEERVAITITSAGTEEPVCGMTFQLGELVGERGDIRAVQVTMHWEDP